MTETQMMFRRLAGRQPRVFWMLLTAVFYGIMSLVDDLITSVGIGPSIAWPSRLVGAMLTSAIFLWIERGRPVDPSVGFNHRGPY